MPEEYVAYRESWRRHHPSWELRLWTEENLPTDFVREEAYERLRKPAERADIIRLEVLLRFGGVYVDADFECLRSIEPLLDGVEFCTAAIKKGRVSNTLIGTTPRHTILERAVRELRPRTEYGLDKNGTGPLFFNRLVREYPEVTIFPAEYFYPATPTQRERAYAIHHFARSWQEPKDLRRALLKAERQLAEARERIEKLERGRLRDRTSRLAARFRRTV
jgi:inositol phosphorylceramide mannosyltransferase catalytic subunit